MAPKSNLLPLVLVATLLLAQVEGQLQQQQQYQQHNNILHFVVPEGAPNNTYLGNIRSADGQPPYLVLPAPQTPESERVQALRIDLLNGDLTTNSVLDREHREQYHFVAIVKEPFAEIKCTVTVKDINDNAPMFLLGASNETNFVIELPENQRGVRKLLPLAVDFDTPQFGIKEFRIVSGNTPSGTFQLVEHEAPARSALQSNLAAANAAEDAASSIVAGDNPQLMQQLAQQAVVLIPSQPMPQSTSNSLTASSSSSTNANGPQPSQSSRFLIDLEVNQTLDRENQSSYQLVVEAIDGGQPPLLGRLLVTVNVQDANDNDPIFSRKLYETHTREDATKGTMLLRVQAHDSDLDFNGQISYFIKRHSSSSQPNGTNYTTYTNNTQQRTTKNTSSQIQDLFEIDQQKGEIYLANQLDYELDQVHELYIEARDHGKPSRSAYALVKIFVIDVNDDPPALPAYSSTGGARNGVQANSNDKSRSSNGPANLQAPTSEPSRSELGSRSSNYLQAVNLVGWFDQINSPTLFSIVLVALFLVAFPVCLVKIKSRKPDTDHYNDTAGLTLSPNGQSVKQSPNHSLNQEHHSSQNQDSLLRHHGEHQRRSMNGQTGGSFGSPPSTKLHRYQYIDSSSNHYHNPYTNSHHTHHHHHHSNKGGTMNSLGTHHSAHPSASPLPATPNTTHSSGLPQNLHDVVTGSHHGPHHNPLLSTQPSMATLHHHHSQIQSSQDQLPPPPCNAAPNIFPWPQGTARTIGGANGIGGGGGSNGGTLGPMTTCGAVAAIAANVGFSPLSGRAASSATLDRWLDLGASSHIGYTHDWCSSYNWDYLADWTPEYHTLMQLFQAG